MKVEKRKIVSAYPGVSLLSEISIKEQKKTVPVGGFTMDGGFYLREGFNIVRRKEKAIDGEKVIYFNFVKDTKKKGVMEKELLKIERKEQRWKTQRKKELQKELNDLKGEK